MNNYIRTFEGFMDLFNKRPKDKSGINWDEKLEWIHNNYKSDKVSDLRSDYSPNDRYDVSWKLPNGEYFHIFIFPSNPSGSYYITDGKLETEDIVHISKKQYLKYVKYIVEISDYLDERENISTTAIDDFFNMDDKKLKSLKSRMEAIHIINKELLSYINNNKLIFESKYFLWKSKNKNVVVIEDIILTDFEFTDLNGLSLKSLNIECKYKGEDMILRINENTSDEYQDLEEIDLKDESSLLKLDYDRSKLSRKERREEKEFPYFIFMDLSPNKWESIEFVKKCKSLIQSISNNMSN